MTKILCCNFKIYNTNTCSFVLLFNAVEYMLNID